VSGLFPIGVCHLEQNSLVTLDNERAIGIHSLPV
jgi:hypothetical protein